MTRYFFLLFFVCFHGMANEALLPCEHYLGHPKHITGKSPAVNMLIQIIQGYSFPNQLTKEDPILSKIDNIEELIKNKIDLVVLWNANENYKNYAQKLEQAHIDTCTINLDSLSQYPSAIETLGKLMHKEARAQELRHFMEEKLAILQSLHTAIPDDKKQSVYYARGTNGLQSACPLSSHAEVIEVASGINLVQCPPIAKSIVTLSAESLLVMNPQVMIIENEDFLASLNKSESPYKSVLAVKNQRLYAIPTEPMNWVDSPPSVLRLLGALWLAKKLYPEYATYDLDKEVRTFKTLFLNQEDK